ncbi:MAG TPA: DEAD/DEAH box helicase, partial [Prevotella sp.]
RIGSPLNCEERYHNHLLEHRVQDCATVSDVKKLIHRSRVVCATTSALNANIQLLSMKSFDLAIIDEASQILEPHVVGLLSAQYQGQESIRKFVLIGDHKQLPAVVQQTTEQSLVEDGMLRSINLTDCRLSLFERLLKSYRNNPSVTYMLTRQGRMHHDIAQFPNYAFYQNALQVVPLKHQLQELPPQIGSANGIENLLATHRIAFLNAPQPEENDATSDKVNKTEAEMIAATVVAAYHLYKEQYNVQETIGVIVPYRNQIATVRNAIDRHGIACLHNITIDTVERYQGSQRDVIVYGFTISKYYQLDFLCNNVFEEEGSIIDRKLNVAMTRAREHLILIGHAALLQENYTFAKLLTYLQQRHCYFDIDTESYCNGTFSVITKQGNASGQMPNTAFRKTLNHLIEQQLQKYPTEWQHLSNEVIEDAMAYGETDFSRHIVLYDKAHRRIILPIKLQVLLYARLYQSAHYEEAHTFFLANEQLLPTLFGKQHNALHFIEFGRDPAAGILAFHNVFGRHAFSMEYTAICPSKPMQLVAKQIITCMAGETMKHSFVGSYNELNSTFWQATAQEGSTVIFNFTHFFAGLTPNNSEQLAIRLVDMMMKNSGATYIFCFDRPPQAVGGKAFSIFIRRLMPHIEKIDNGLWRNK